jgi:anti-sigma factor RsiW
MSLKEIRSECSDVAGLLQPYVDAELSDDERKSMAAHLEGCAGCRAAVSEQLWVRATLRALEVERAPRALMARVLSGLDEVDRERAAELESARPSGWARMSERLGKLLRGALVMVPAAAVAAALFFVVRGGLDTPSVLPGAGLAGALHGREVGHGSDPAHASSAGDSSGSAARALSDIEPQVGFPIQVAKPGAEIQLVGARVDDADHDEGPAAHLRYRVFEAGRATGRHLIDRQRPAIGTGPAGTPVTFGGRQYLVGQALDGNPIVYFQRGGVAHAVMLEGTPGPAGRSLDMDSSPDFSHLLDLAHRLAQESQ